MKPDISSCAQVLDRCIEVVADLRTPPPNSLPGAAEAIALLRAEALRLAAGDRDRVQRINARSQRKLQADRNTSTSESWLLEEAAVQNGVSSRLPRAPFRRANIWHGDLNCGAPPLCVQLQQLL